MTKPEQSMKEINSLLFDDKAEVFDGINHNANAQQQKIEPRLMKQRGLSSDMEQLEPVPYYKRPMVQVAVLLVFAVPTGWGLISAFTTPEEISNSQTQLATNTYNKQNQLLQQSLEQERKKSQDLAIENGLRVQQMEVIPVKTKPSPQSPHAKPISAPPEPTIVHTTAPRRTYVSQQPIITSRPSPSLPPSRPVSYTSSPSRPASYTPPPFRPVAPTISKPLAPVKIEPKVDPVQQWMAAANIGNYGGMSSVSNSQTTASVPSDDSYQTADYQTGSTTTGNSDWQLSGGLGRPPAQTNSKTEINSQQSSYQEVNYSTAATNVVVGTRVNGKLETPIAWSGKLENPGQNFLIQLTEPIKAADKSIAVPNRAYLVAQVSDATESGLIQMSVSSVVVTENGQTSERPISPGAILILGKGGRPLKASAQGRSSRNADLGMAILSGVSNVTGLINQPSSQSAFSSGGGFTTTTTNRNPNYIAGFGQGAAQAIVGEMQRRNQQTRQSTQSEPRVFVLNQGTSVQVFVNQSVAL